MEDFAVDLDKVLDDFEESEGKRYEWRRARAHTHTHTHTLIWYHTLLIHSFDKIGIKFLNQTKSHANF